ncbi:MAG: ABC-2 family transporter protein [Polyangiaceae bacterium]
MSLRNTVRAGPTMLRVGLAGAVAYRAELLVWALATTLPLVMLALWSSVAQQAPIGRFGQPQFTAYFLSTFIVRQLTGSWAFWEMNSDVKSGTLGTRLLRPVHPLFAYAAENLAAIPLRLLIALPVAAVLLATVGARCVTHDPAEWAIFALAVSGAWLLTLLTNLIVGCAAFFLESSVKLMDLYLVFFFVLSGYLIPVDLFPATLRRIVEELPFRYQVGFPVEVMTGGHSRISAIDHLARQWAWIAVLLLATRAAWLRGLRRFAAFGG